MGGHAEEPFRSERLFSQSPRPDELPVVSVILCSSFLAEERFPALSRRAPKSLVAYLRAAVLERAAKPLEAPSSWEAAQPVEPGS